MEFQAPFTACVSAATKTGKTEWTKNLVRNAKYLIKPAPDKIYWAYGNWQPGYNEIAHLVTFIEGIPSQTMFQDTSNKLLICDDLMRDFKKDEISQLFCQGSHHWNLCVVHIVQNLFFNQALRTARINSHYIILMKNPSDRLQLLTLCRQIFPGKQKQFLEAYDDACAEPYGYLLLDLSPATDDNMRLRTKIFPGDISIVYLL